jgi:peptidoglycan/LPS O-acetylase OafA/YrhL
VTAAARAPRLDSLTGLRFFAALLVFAHHTLAPSITSHGLADLPVISRVADLGSVGVTFFFVLSGFVLTWSWAPGSREAFYGRRFARIWPLHAVTFVAACFVVAPLLDHSPPDAGRQVLGLSLLQAWSWHPSVYFAGNGPSWSLSCEAFFYALLPFLAPLALRLSRRGALLVAAGCAAVLALAPLAVRPLHGSALQALWVFPAYRVAEFVVGVLLAAAVRSGWRPRLGLPGAVGLAVVSYLVVAWVLQPVSRSSSGTDQFLANLYGDLLLLVPFALLIAAAALSDLDGGPALLRSRALVRLGEASFAFYLVHTMVVLLLARSGVLKGTASGVPLVLLALVVSTAAAWLLHRCLERPAERRLRRAFDAREGRTAAPLLDT